MKLNEFVKMHKNFTKGMKTLNEESMENFDVEKFTQDLDDADAIASGEGMTFTPEETTTRCFSQMGHKVSFNDAVTLLFDYLGQKNLADFAIIGVRDKDAKCDQDLVAAIKIAQEDLGVKDDGIMGRNTIGALRKATLDPEFLNNTDNDKDKPFTPFGDEIDKEMKPVQSVNKKEIEDSSRPSGNSRYVTYIEQNLQIVESACQEVLGTEFSFTTDGIKNLQKAAGFSGETTSFNVIVKGKATTRTIEGQIDGKIGPHTMTAFTLLYFINQEMTPQSDTPMATRARLNPSRMFESCNLSLKDRLENNLQFINEEEDDVSFEKFANTKYFKSRVANTHSIMKLQNPSIPPFNQINFPFDNQSLIGEKYEIHESIGIAKKYGKKRIELIKIMIDQIKASMPSDAHSPEAIIAILAVCAKESAFGRTKEGTAYSFGNIKTNKTGNAVSGRVNKRFLDHIRRYPTDDEIRAIVGGGRNGIALFNIAYGYDRMLQLSGYDRSDRRIPASVKVVVDDPSTGEKKINPALYNPELAGFKYRGHGAVQMTGYGNYRYLEKIANDQGGEVAKMFKGVKDDPEIVISTPEHNVISSIIYMNFPHAKNSINRAKQKGGETEMEFLVRKYASGPFGSTIGQKRYSSKKEKWYEPSMSSRINGQINLSAASNKTADFIIVE